MRESFVGAAPDFTALNPGYMFWGRDLRGRAEGSSSYLIALIRMKIASAPISFA